MNNSYPQKSASYSISALRRRLEGFSRLLKVTRSLAAEIEPQAVLETIISQACKALQCERASLFRYDSETQELYTTLVTELEISEIRSGLDMGITGFVARTREIANIPEPSQDTRWNSKVDLETGFKTRNILSAPLISPYDRSLLGVLQLLNKEDGQFDEADEELLEAFSQHAAVALHRAGLLEEVKRRQKVDASLNAAREIQRGFMPQNLPNISGYEAATWWFPHQAIGGDYCDLIPFSDNRTGLCIADVSGHGIGPSLIMASARAALRALSLKHSSSQELLTLLGQALYNDLQNGMFITMVLTILDPTTHIVEFTNAGHSPAFLYSAKDGKIQHLEANGMPLGVSELTDFEPSPSLRMNTGDLLVLCTDGIVEAVDEKDIQFGLSRLENLIHENSKKPVELIVQTVGDRMREYYSEGSPRDDLTILAVRRNN